MWRQGDTVTWSCWVTWSQALWNHSDTVTWSCQVTQGHGAQVTQSLCPMLRSPGDVESGIEEPQ